MLKSSRHIAFGGCFLAAALLCGYVESMVPLTPGIPGIRLGLPNLVTVLLLYTAGAPMALAVSCGRILLSGLLFGSGVSLLYSLAGGFASFAVMFFLRRGLHAPPVAVSCIGGLTHNAAQLAVAAVFLRSRALLYYLPVLAAAGIFTGFVIGVLSAVLIPRMRNLF